MVECDKFRCLKGGVIRCVTWHLFNNGKSEAYLPAVSVCSQFTDGTVFTVIPETDQEIHPTGITTGQAFGSLTFTGGSSPVTVHPTGIATGQAFGTAVVTPGTASILAVGITTGQAFGTAVASTGSVTVHPTGIATGQAFGTTVVTPGVASVLPTGIATGQAFGSTTVSEAAGTSTILPTGIATGQAFGSATVFQPPTVITSFPVGNPGGQIPTVLVRDITNGYDLYDLNADTQSQYPASCTKVMTALLAYEYHSGDWTTGTATVTLNDTQQQIPGIILTMAGLGAGDIVTWEGLVYCIFLPSGGDACMCIAHTIGDEIYAAAGNTGTQGVTRFIERMNSRAVELGMTNTTYFDPYGGSRTDGPTVIRNIISARDLATVSVECFQHSAIRTIINATTFGVVITGPSARTLNLTNGNGFINGPTISTPIGFKDPNVIGGKLGVWQASASINNLTQLWVTPSGAEVIITTIGSQILTGMMMDQRGLFRMLARDFPYLYAGGSVSSDPYISNVKVLVGADGSIVDESPVARSLTVANATVGTPILYGSTGSIRYTGTSDLVSVPDAADISVGTGDMTVEMWWCGNGTVPGTESIWFSKATAGGNYEWVMDENGQPLNFFMSSNGTGFTSVATAHNFGPGDRPTFFNGAPRHLALTKSGTTWRFYVDGEMCPVTISTDAFDGTSPMFIGGFNGASALVGRIDDFRYTAGVARYTDSMYSLLPYKFSRT